MNGHQISQVLFLSLFKNKTYTNLHKFCTHTCYYCLFILQHGDAEQWGRWRPWWWAMVPTVTRRRRRLGMGRPWWRRRGERCELWPVRDRGLLRQRCRAVHMFRRVGDAMESSNEFFYGSGWRRSVKRGRVDGNDRVLLAERASVQRRRCGCGGEVEVEEESGESEMGHWEGLLGHYSLIIGFSTNLGLTLILWSVLLTSDTPLN